MKIFKYSNTQIHYVVRHTARCAFWFLNIDRHRFVFFATSEYRGKIWDIYLLLRQHYYKKNHTYVFTFLYSLLIICLTHKLNKKLRLCLLSILFFTYYLYANLSIHGLLNRFVRISLDSLLSRNSKSEGNMIWLAFMIQG